MLYASEPSIRRDLMNLEKQGLIKRIHGGAIIEEDSISTSKIPFVVRELEQSDAKIIMAKAALAYISDRDVLFLDASSSAYALIPFLATKSGLTVITNGIKAVEKLSEYNIKTICTGGELNSSTQALCGEDAYETIERYNADLCFFSCRGLSPQGYLTDISAEENNIRKRMIAHSRKSYFLCASEKFGKTYYHNLMHASMLTGIVSEGELPDFIVSEKKS